MTGRHELYEDGTVIRDRSRIFKVELEGKSRLWDALGETRAVCYTVPAPQHSGNRPQLSGLDTSLQGRARVQVKKAATPVASWPLELWHSVADARNPHAKPWASIPSFKISSCLGESGCAG